MKKEKEEQEKKRKGRVEIYLCPRCKGKGVEYHKRDESILEGVCQVCDGEGNIEEYQDV